MRIKILIIANFLILGLIVSFAQKESNLALENFFKSFKDKPIQTVERLYSDASNLKTTHPILKKKAINDLKSSLNGAGTFVNYKLIKTNTLSPRKKEIICLVKYENKPLKLLFLLHDVDNIVSIQNLKIIQEKRNRDKPNEAKKKHKVIQHQ